MSCVSGARACKDCLSSPIWNAGTAVSNSFNGGWLVKDPLSDSRRGKRGAQSCELFAPPGAVCVCVHLGWKATESWNSHHRGGSLRPLRTPPRPRCSYAKSSPTARALSREGGSHSQKAGHSFFFSFWIVSTFSVCCTIADSWNPTLCPALLCSALQQSSWFKEVRMSYIPLNTVIQHICASSMLFWLLWQIQPQTKIHCVPGFTGWTRLHPLHKSIKGTQIQKRVYWWLVQC